MDIRFQEKDLVYLTILENLFPIRVDGYQISLQNTET